MPGVEAIIRCLATCCVHGSCLQWFDLYQLPLKAPPAVAGSTTRSPYLVDVGGCPPHHALIKAVPVECDVPPDLLVLHRTTVVRLLLSCSLAVPQ